MRWTPLILGVLLVAALAILPATASAQATGTKAKAATAKASHSALASAPKAGGSADRVLLPPIEDDIMPGGATGTAGVPLAPKATVSAAVSPKSGVGLPSATKAPKGAPKTTVADKTGPLTPPVPPAPAGPRTFPYPGAISADMVNIRSGPGPFYYAVAQLKKDERVTVESEDNGWLALKPLPGVVGLMHKADVTLSADSKAASVSAPGARVYASSPTAKRHWSVMITLNPGDPVKVLGVEGDMVRITPPEAARVYVVADFVSAGPAASASGTVEVADFKAPQPDPLYDEFAKTVAAAEAERLKPIPEQHFEELIAKFKDLGDKAGKSWEQQEALKWIAYLGSLRERQAEYLKVQGLGTKLDQTLAELKAKQIAAENAKAAETKGVKPEFMATGVVAKMDSIPDVDYPIKFKLVDQQNKPIVVLASSAFDLNKYIGKVVGVRGTKTYLKDWRIYLITVDELEVLE